MFYFQKLKFWSTLVVRKFFSNCIYILLSCWSLQTRNLILVSFLFCHADLFIYLRSKLHPPVVPPFVSPLTFFFYFLPFSFLFLLLRWVRKTKYKILPSLFRVDIYLFSTSPGSHNLQQWGKIMASAFLPPIFHQMNYFWGPVPSFLAELSHWEGRVNPTLKLSIVVTLMISFLLTRPNNTGLTRFVFLNRSLWLRWPCLVDCGHKHLDHIPETRRRVCVSLLGAWFLPVGLEVAFCHLLFIHMVNCELLTLISIHVLCLAFDEGSQH